jgi:hypothetical protein
MACRSGRNITYGRIQRFLTAGSAFTMEQTPAASVWEFWLLTIHYPLYPPFRKRNMDRTEPHIMERSLEKLHTLRERQRMTQQKLAQEPGFTGPAPMNKLAFPNGLSSTVYHLKYHFVDKINLLS